MKRLYRSSNGTKGANIVVTNYSGGIPKVFPDDPSFKPWCDLYNLLGTEGILSIGSAPNDEVDVDVVGDMPSTCTSPYFICVTNIDESGKKIVDAGFGKKSVDIGAPGDKVETTKTFDTYGSFTGTSASAPMVAGVIALLYAIPCSTLATMTKQNPKAASELVRDAVLSGTTYEASLNNITTSNGILNGEKALTKLLEVCNDIILPSPKGNLTITNVEVLSNRVRIEYIAPDDENESLMLIDASGKTIQFHTFAPIKVGQRYFELTIPSEVPHGVYVLTLIHGEEVASRSLALFR
jgi:subtilisin family serine protease